MIILKQTKQLNQDQVLELYNRLGWTAYTSEPEQLMKAIANSLSVVTAWDKDKLVGLIRVVGDGLTIIYIQDILVQPSYQNNGIGTQLIEQILRQFHNVRQKVLLTEEDSRVRHFYQKHQFQSCDQGNIVAFARLENKE
ncbi:Acetyltransferase (GNAT) domain-containing protein [Amphibacillus marinus]|uniref:Acetyltransferase (GNAT) domain-containing protein n=1 Tax=Amphibacillus marinus TaxID=872970 RepID=A0A1H8KA52_9BACI|nr:GNAT family N-acetyltransferase [Amphibacillus marinus]SEN89833.1 Acetyltransferase (GNAT) domain-containing protein [Amphibacillus marinus]